MTEITTSNFKLLQFKENPKRTEITPPSGSGPEDPMLEKRFEKLEETMKSIESALIEIKTTLKFVATSSELSRLEARIPEIVIAEIKERSNYLASAAEVARIDGRVSNIPTIWQLIGVLITIAMLVFAASNFLGQTPRQSQAIEKLVPSKP